MTWQLANCFGISINLEVFLWFTCVNKKMNRNQEICLWLFRLETYINHINAITWSCDFGQMLFWWYKMFSFAYKSDMCIHLFSFLWDPLWKQKQISFLRYNIGIFGNTIKPSIYIKCFVSFDIFIRIYFLCFNSLN